MGNVDLEDRIGTAPEVMGNKNTIPPKGPDPGAAQREEGLCVDGAAGKMTLLHLVFIQRMTAV